MAKHRTHRTHSIAFKRRVIQEYLAGETLHGLARRHDLSRTLIRIRVDKYETGAFDEEADTHQEPEVPLPALDRDPQARTSSPSSTAPCPGTGPSATT